MPKDRVAKTPAKPVRAKFTKSDLKEVERISEEISNDEIKRQISMDSKVVLCATPYQITMSKGNSTQYFDRWDQVLEELFKQAIAKNITRQGAMYDRLIRAYRMAADEVKHQGEIIEKVFSSEKFVEFITEQENRQRAEVFSRAKEDKVRSTKVPQPITR